MSRGRIEAARLILKKRMRIGIFDQTAPVLGGGQLVASYMAAVLSTEYDVDLIRRDNGHDLRSLSASFSLDLSRVKHRISPVADNSFSIPGLSAIFELTDPAIRNLSKSYDLFIFSGHGVPPGCYAKRGIIYSHFPFEESPIHAFKMANQNTRYRMAGCLIRTWVYQRIWRARMCGYQKILANSKFTATWLQQRWERIAEVLYPPVDLQLPPADKQNLIVSLGRFTGDLRSKNQIEQVKAFREFLKLTPEPWRLRTIGTGGESAKDRDYLAAVQKEAHGLPVEVIVNADRNTIVRSLAEAKLFWHTTGLSNDETEKPEHAEHFGIATVEAMRAGCVPVVIASGGQCEIVENGVSGFLVVGLGELVNQSLKIIHDAKLLGIVSEQATQRSMHFGRSAFEQRLKRIVARCLNERLQ